MLRELRVDKYKLRGRLNINQCHVLKHNSQKKKSKKGEKKNTERESDVLPSLVSVAALVRTTPLKHTVGSRGSDEGKGNHLALRSEMTERQTGAREGSEEMTHAEKEPLELGLSRIRFRVVTVGIVAVAIAIARREGFG
jgi:hypothetical protein